MAAAYAALVSLMNILDRHTRIPLPIDQDQIQALNEKVSFLVDFLESDSHGTGKEDEDLEMRIADAVYEVEDMIESRVVDNILASYKGEIKKTSMLSRVDMEKVLDGMEVFVQEVIRQIKVRKVARGYSLPFVKDTSFKDHSLSSLPAVKGTVVGKELMERLTGGASHRQIIPIIGMGGIGKTTLAKTFYEDPYVVNYFDICAWVSVSQEYSLRQILSGLLKDRKFDGQMSEIELGNCLHKYLFGRRYLVVLDDLWSREVIEMIGRYLPDNHNRSRIIVTSRISGIWKGENEVVMSLMNEETSWNLLREKVFAGAVCPVELEEVVRKIAKNCKGLPLAIVAIGGILSESKEKEYWEHVARETCTVMGYEGDGGVMDMFLSSFRYLPIYLKPCFLYMGVFPADQGIRVKMLINLWVAEGFLKPNSSKDVEVIAEEYLNELVSRNLVYVGKRGYNGKIKLCYIHDLLRELCLTEARRQKFLFTMDMHSYDFQQGISNKRRICINDSEKHLQALNAMTQGSPARSLTCDLDGVLPLQNFRLLRVFNATDKYACVGSRRKNLYVIDDILQLVNSRYIAFRAANISLLPSSLSLLKNVQTLVVVEEIQVIAPLEVWEMIELRHLEFRFGLYLPDPPSQRGDMQDVATLKSLHTIMKIENFRCSIEVVKRIPNIKKLKISYGNVTGGYGEYCLQNLCLLMKLESLTCSFETSQTDLPKSLSLPILLKKLTLSGCGFQWEDMGKIGNLPHLEVLKLGPNSFRGSAWEPVEGQFLSLRYLLVDKCDDLVEWSVESTHFPHLEHLVLRRLSKLEEIPPEFGETLLSIQLDFCSQSSVMSAMTILEEQESVKVSIHPKYDYEGILATHSYPEYDNKRILASDSFPVESAQVEEKSAYDVIQAVKPGESTVTHAKVENLSPTDQVKYEVHCSDEPEESNYLGQSIHTPILTDSSQEVDHTGTTLNEIMAAENLSPVELSISRGANLSQLVQINCEAHCSDEPEENRNLGQSIQTPISTDILHSIPEVDHNWTTTVDERVTADNLSPMEQSIIRGANLSRAEQINYESHCSDEPEGSSNLEQSTQTPISTYTSQSTREVDHSSTPLDENIATENLSHVEQCTARGVKSPLEQMNPEAVCLDEPEWSKNLGQSIQTPISIDTLRSTQQVDHSNTTLDESITITISGTGKLHKYVDMQLKIFHASLKQVQHPSWDFSHLDLDSMNNVLLFLVKKKLPNQNFDQPNCPLSTQYAIHQLNGVVPAEYLINRSFGGSTKLLTTEEWHTAGVVSLVEMGQFALPEKPDCPNLVVLFLQSEHRRFDIPLSFFHLMRALKFLDLSGTKIMKLPSSLFSCTELQVLLLRNCVYLDDLPLEIGNLQSMEVLDLSGTELRNLPNQVGGLKYLKDLQLSLYGPEDDSEYVHLPSELVSGNILSKLQELQALSIDVHPEDYRWRKIAGDVTLEISVLKYLGHLQFYFPEVRDLQVFVEGSPSWSGNTLKSFKFVVGRDVKRIIHRVPEQVELKFNQRARCLRFVNGDDLTQTVKDVLGRATAFCLDHHSEVQSLSQFGNSNLEGLNFCVLRECPNLEVIIDGEQTNNAILPSLEYLELHYLWKLRHIWNSVPMSLESFRALKRLTVCSCPVLPFIFPVTTRICLSNLEELFVEDCEAVTKISDGEIKTVVNNVNLFPQLRKVELRYLPRLVSLGIGLFLTKDKISVHGCPNLNLNVNPRKSWGSLCGCLF